jgi:hypothetical protein
MFYFQSCDILLSNHYTPPQQSCRTSDLPKLLSKPLWFYSSLLLMNDIAYFIWLFLVIKITNKYFHSIKLWLILYKIMHKHPQMQVDYFCECTAIHAFSYLIHFHLQKCFYFIFLHYIHSVLVNLYKFTLIFFLKCWQFILVSCLAIF